MISYNFLYFNQFHLYSAYAMLYDIMIVVMIVFYLYITVRMYLLFLLSN